MECYMNKTKNVLQVLVQIGTAESVQDLKHLIQETIGDVDIARYSVGQNSVVLYIEVAPSDNLHTILIEDDCKTYSLINVIESILETSKKEYTGTVQEAFAQKQGEPKAATVIIFERDPLVTKLLTQEFKLTNISVYDGLVSISTDGELILIEPQVKVTIDYSTYNPSTGTVRLAQGELSEEVVDEVLELFEDITNHLTDSIFLIDNPTDKDEYEDEIRLVMNIYNIKDRNLAEFVYDFDLSSNLVELQKSERTEQDILDELMQSVRERDEDLEVFKRSQSLTEQFKDSVFGPGIASAEEHARMSTEKHTVNLMADIMNVFNAIENNEPYQIPTEALERMNTHDRNIHEMKNILLNVQELGEEISMDKALREDISNSSVPVVAGASQSGFVSEYDIDALSTYGIGDTVVESVTLKVALISYDSFDEYAKNHNIVGWDLFTPTTLLIKYTEDGVTSDEKIAKFHDMMNSLDTGWVEKSTNGAKFLSELHQVLDRDMVAEFLNRVKKHNIFVRENLAKMRSALLDMEKDFEQLKDDVNLTIDWEGLTAFASKKERTEHRTKGVSPGTESPINVNGVSISVNGVLPTANLVKVNTGLVEGDFYIPVHLLTDEHREKYVLDNYAYYIDDVPDYAFYEIAVNGHFMIIEKTDL